MEIKISCKIKGLENLEKKINTITKKLPQTIEQGVEEVLKNIQGCAIRLERGHNENGILVEMVDVSNNKVKGRVYADPSKFMTENGQSYLWFEHFGTGQYAEMEHVGKTPHFLESGYTEWLIPVNKVERKLNYRIITIKGHQFYLAHGVKANHFMTDAEFQTRDNNTDTMQKHIYQMLEEVCK